jgi:hypothetical protein
VLYRNEIGGWNCISFFVNNGLRCLRQEYESGYFRLGLEKWSKRVVTNDITCGYWCVALHFAWVVCISWWVDSSDGCVSKKRGCMDCKYVFVSVWTKAAAVGLSSIMEMMFACTLEAWVSLVGCQCSTLDALIVLHAQRLWFLWTRSLTDSAWALYRTAAIAMFTCLPNPVVCLLLPRVLRKHNE